MHDFPLGTGIMDVNEKAAAANRRFFDSRGLFTVNLMSAPGAGKTSLLESTIRLLNGRHKIGVIEGDLVTTIDSDRISTLGVPAHQITTGTVCHLDARMIYNCLHEFDVSGMNLLFIENVGNLVCPAEFNLGEHLKIMVFSTVEGAEKPKKYPLMFHEADAVVLNKIDLLPYSGVSFDELCENVSDVNPTAPIFPVSCRSRQGLTDWVDWLAEKIEAPMRAESA